MDPSIASPLVWAGFLALVVALLGVDLALHRGGETVSTREALLWSAVWISLGLAFGAGLWWWKGSETGLEYFTGYVVEKSLSVDNIFVFVVLFGALAVPREQQHRVLFFGVLGALVMRGVFIAVGAELLHHFHWVVVPMGAFLVVAGARLLAKGGEMHPERGRLVQWLRRALKDHPFLLALIAVELTDLLFAVDSVPAVFAVTDDPFIVFTSNIFALLGLRSLYFVLAGLLERLHLLKLGLALVLVFVGGKMVVAPWFHVATGISLAVVLALIAGSVALSLVLKPRAPGPAVPIP